VYKIYEHSLKLLSFLLIYSYLRVYLVRNRNLRSNGTNVRTVTDKTSSSAYGVPISKHSS